MAVILLLNFEDCKAQVVNKMQRIVDEIPTTAKDTVLTSKRNYQEKALISDSSANIHVFLSRRQELAEVEIKGQSLKSALKDMEDAYRDKGIFFKGKPPIYLLSPFGGSPVTFFYELFSKDSKRARRLQKFAKGKIEHSEVSWRFNDNIIKSVLPGISDIELEQFKIAYRPTAKQIAAWSDYDLLAYIKRSFDQFKASRIVRWRTSNYGI